MHEGKRDKIKTNVYNFFSDFSCLLMTGFTWVGDKIKLLINKTVNYGYVGLGPIDDAENASEYLRALEWAIKNKAISNIAVAGPYGAGKSSVINTFVKKHPCIKHINISLAAFRENDQENIDTEGKNFERLLEEGILKQLFYKVNYSKIPQSRYRKLHKVSLGTSFMRILIIVVLIVCFTFLFAPEKIKEMIDAYSNTMSNLFGWNVIFQVIFAIGLWSVILIIMTSIFRWINIEWRSIEINVSDKAVIKADEVGHALSLNKNMDEILYFFEETKYTLVIIEDLDRFDTTEVYTKLREINKIINDYDAIRRRVVFIYALKDDIFHNEDRTKFFDFIIPIIPYIDSTNSGEYLKKRLNEIRSTGISFDIADEYIMNVAPYVSDMRLLNNICNEFIIFKKTIKDVQNLEKLQDVQMLSIMIFKNMYPEEFALLQDSEGIIKKAYSDKSKFIDIVSADLKGEIEDIEEKKKKSDGQEILSAEDVKLAFIQRLVDDKGIFLRIQGTKGTFSKDDILKDDFSLTQIGAGVAKVYYLQPNYYRSELSETINAIENVMCSDGITYYEKCDRAISRDKDRRKQIVQNLLDKQRQLYELRSQTMKMLIKEYGADKVLSEDINKNKLLVFMLRHGYIDNTYQMYINYFLPGSITIDELNFIINVRNFEGKTEWDYRIIHPENVIGRLFDYELEQQKECLNFDLAEFFYGDDKKYEKKTGFTKQLAKNDEDSRNFIKEYYLRTTNKSEYIRSIAKEKPLFWFDICSDEALGYKDKLTYLIDIFMFLEVEDIILQDTAASEVDSAYSICTFIAESGDMIVKLQDAGTEKVVKVLTQIKIKLKNFNIHTVDAEIVKSVFAYELFEISLVMLQNYVNFVQGEAVENFESNIYTYILEQGDTKIIEYLDRNIDKLVTDVLLPTEANTKEDIETVFRCMKLLDYDEALSIQIIHKMEASMRNLKDWYDTIKDQNKDVKNIVDTFLTENKMVASVENFDTYKSLYSFSPMLSGFVDENILVFLSDEMIDDLYVKDFLKMNIKNETVERILQNYKMNAFNEKLNSFPDNVVQTMIKLKYFTYSRSRYNEIHSAFPNMLPLFAEHYWDEFEPDIPIITFDLKVIDSFLDSNLDDDKKMAFLNQVKESELTNVMLSFVMNTEVKVPKRYLQAAWNKTAVNDRPAFMIKHFYSFSIAEIENMFTKMPDSYHKLKQEYSRHEVLLEKNEINEILCKKMLSIGYISSYDTKKQKDNVENIVARVKARRHE